MYQVPDKSLWKGRIHPDPGDLLYHQVIQMLDMTHDLWIPRTSQNYAILGFCSDEGVRRNMGRIGATNGPHNLRSQLAGLAVHFDVEKVGVVDAGNVICNGQNLESAFVLLEKKISSLLSNGFIPIIFGGGHETSYPHFTSLRKFYNKKKLGIIDFNAHLDVMTYESGQHAGSSFRNIMMDIKAEGGDFHYLPVGIRPEANVRSLFRLMDESQQQYIQLKDVKYNFEEVLGTIKSFVQNLDAVYVTIDLDCFHIGIAPGVSTPNPEGLDLHEVKMMLDQIYLNTHIVAADLVELNPLFDPDYITAKTAAIIANYLLHKV